MRKFTLLAISASLAVSGMAQSQTKTAVTLQQARNLVSKFIARQATVNKLEAKQTVKMPRTINQYAYDNGNWTLETQISYRYDNNGNLGMQETVAADNSYKLRSVYTYDSKETGYCTSETQYQFTPSDSKEPVSAVVGKSDVVRDAQGRVTGITNYSLDETSNELLQTYHTTFEYDGENTKPVKMVRVDIYRDDNQKEQTQTMEYQNIVWADGFDGKLLQAYGSSTEDMILDKANRIKSADLTLSTSESTATLDGTLTGTYLDGKSILDFSMIYGSVVIMQQIYTDEYLDNNGSHCLSLTYNQMQDDLSGFDTSIISMTQLYNDKKEELEQTLRQGTSSTNMAIEQSVKYDNTYNAETGLRDYAILSEYDTATKTYSPKTKMEIVKYIDVTGIDAVAETAGNGKTEIYNAQGMFVGNDLNALGTGLYVVKQNGKSFKVAK